MKLHLVRLNQLAFNRASAYLLLFLALHLLLVNLRNAIRQVFLSSRESIKERFFSLSLRQAGNVCHQVSRPLAVFHFLVSFRSSGEGDATYTCERFVAIEGNLKRNFRKSLPLFCLVIDSTNTFEFYLNTVRSR